MDLKSILLDATQNGAYFFLDRDCDSLTITAAHLNFYVANVELKGAKDKVEMMERFANGLAIPSWFGGNWDGLADVLRDLSWLPDHVGVVINFPHSKDLQLADPETFDTMLDILNEAAHSWADDHKPFWAILPTSKADLSQFDSMHEQEDTH